MPRPSDGPTDPRPQGPAPEFPQQPIDPPGSIDEMNPPADHGERSYRGSNRLARRRALITGGDSGIGRATAIAFAREGADVLISHLPEEASDAADTCRLIEEAGRRAIAVAGDIQDESLCAQLVDRAFDDLGGLDVLVNNAAYQLTHESIADYSTAELDRTFRTNVYAMFWLCRAALPRMVPGSVIINTASIQAFQPSAQLLAYAASKAAIVNFTKALSQMAMERGVRVNAVAPGPVWTPLIPSTMPADHVATFGSNTSYDRPAQPVEVAPVYVFLASEDARYVTGEVYGVTGGRTPY